VQLGGRHGAHLPALHEGLGIVFGQKADEAPRQDQRGNRLLVERRGPALQVAAVRQRHVGRVVAQAGKVRSGPQRFPVQRRTLLIE